MATDPGLRVSPLSPAAFDARRLPGLRAHLVALVLFVLVPALVFGAVAAWQALQRQDQAEEARLLDTSQALAAAVDARIGAKVAALRVLGAQVGEDPELAPEPLLGHARTVA
jgi:hypothetical protein